MSVTEALAVALASSSAAFPQPVNSPATNATWTSPRHAFPAPTCTAVSPLG
ncbi:MULTISPECIES: hypothetical protein [Streptomyces]|uniref:hypothetical protein n=1 Tax=Streptomyces TaxID=1883 RepID=UPI001E2C2467|nr:MULTISPECIES: hypothetical protein [Streptomyces]